MLKIGEEILCYTNTRTIEATVAPELEQKFSPGKGIDRQKNV